MPIETLINAVKQWATRTFATRGDVDAAAREVVEANAPDWKAAEGKPGHIANKPQIVGAEGTATDAEVFNGLDSSRATGNYSHAEGNGLAQGAYAHAEGGYFDGDNGGTAYGRGSHAEGYATLAEGDCSHAEGGETIAKGPYSHSEGSETQANSQAAHAEGKLAVADGTSSHAEGLGTRAYSYCQHVQGSYNIVDETGSAFGKGTYAHIVGNGTGSKRSNAHTLDWDGNAWYAGTVLVGGTSQADAAEVATKAYVDEMLGVIENGSY